MSGHPNKYGLNNNDNFMILHNRKTSIKWFHSWWVQQLRYADPAIILLALPMWLVSLWLLQLKTLSTVKCRKRTKSLACVPFLEHWKLFQWPIAVLSLRLISQVTSNAWTCIYHWHMNRINTTGLNWSSFNIDPWWEGRVFGWRHREGAGVAPNVWRTCRHLPATREEVGKTLG